MKYLRCEVSRRKRNFPEGHKFAGRKCPNKHGFQYPRFEELLFSLFSPPMIPVIQYMVPHEQQNEIVTRLLAECETQISDHERQIQNLVEMVAIASNNNVATAYHVKIEKTQAALDRLQVQRERFRQQVSFHNESQEVAIAKVITSLQDSTDPTALYDRRSKLNRLLASYVRVILHDDVTVTVQINEHSGLNRVEARFSLSGLDSINVMDRDGSVLTQFEGPALMMLEPINRAA